MLKHVGRFVVKAWIIMAGVAGMFGGILYIFQKHIIVAAIAIQVFMLSFLFGFFGWKDYKLKESRVSWHRDRTERDQGWGGLDKKATDNAEEEI